MISGLEEGLHEWYNHACKINDKRNYVVNLYKAVAYLEALDPVNWQDTS